LHGFSVQIKQGWSVKVIGNSIVIKNEQENCYIQVRGVRHNGDLKQVAQRWFSERQMMDIGNARFAFRQTGQGIVIFGEGLGFPHPLSPMAAVNAGLIGIPLPDDFNEVTVILPGKAMALVVSFLFPRGTREETRRQMVEIVRTLKFLPPEEMVGWREEVIIDPEVGMEAVRMHVPEGFEFQGTVAVIGAMRQPIFVIRKGETVIRHDNISLSTNVVQSGFMSSGGTILNINGQASQQPQPIFLSEPEDSVKLLSAIWRAATGKDWQVVETMPLPKSEIERMRNERMEREAEQGLAAMGAIAKFTNLKLAYLMRSGELVQLGTINGTLLVSQSPHPIAATQGCQLGMMVRSIQFREREHEKVMGIVSGIGASEYVSPQFALSALERFIRDQKALNRMVQEMLREHREFNTRMATAWTNLLSDQTYVKDPQTNEIFRLHKNSWETGNFWREPIFGDVILGGVREGSKLEELLRMEGWRRLTESLEGFPEMWK
ncbi:MAG: hypothetical protein ACK4I8_06495, partial [Armatimonadota bacterium]